MAALPRVDNFFLFSRRVLALKGAEVPPLREAAATLSASGGQRQPKILNVNANNRSERAEQENFSLKSVAKTPKNLP